MKKKVICTKTFDKKKIANIAEWFIKNYGSIKTTNLLNKLKTIGFKYATKGGLSLGIEDLKTPKIKKKILKKTSKYIKKLKKIYYYGQTTIIELLKKEIKTWNILNNIIKNEIIINFRQSNLMNPVYMMIYSGARGNITQIKQIIGMRGLMSDSNGEIISSPIKSSLKEGLNNKEYFISCYGARKGIIDTALKTANSGYLTRKLIYVSQNIIVKQQDCKTKNGNIIKLKIKNKKNYTKLKNKIMGTIIAEDVISTKKKILASKGQDICNYTAKILIKNEIFIFLRSLLMCKINIGVCQLCYGWNLTNNKIVKLGEAIGILAAQSIGEPGTQLTMRTFHTGGIFSSKTNKIITSPEQGILTYPDTQGNGKKIKNKFGENFFFFLKETNILIKKNKLTIYKILLPTKSIIFLKPNKKVFEKQIIGETLSWKTLNIKNKEQLIIKSTNSGETQFNEKNTKKVLWIKNGQIFENINMYKLLKKKFNTKKKEEIFKKIKKYTIKYKKLTKLNYKENNKLKNEKKNKKKPIIYELGKIKYKEKILILNRKTFKLSSDKGKNIGEIYNKKKGIITGKKKKEIIIHKSVAYNVPNSSITNITNNNIIKNNTTIISIKYEKDKTKDIVEGLPKIEEILETKRNRNYKKINNNIHEKLHEVYEIYKFKYKNKIAVRKTIEKIQNKLIKQVKKVYNSQDIDISEKHIGIIVKRITSKVIITTKGDSKLLEGELIDINKIEILNKFLKKKAKYDPILIGISKISLLTESFISATCFQETIRTLSKSAIMGKVDWLSGLKENIILGNLIPGGSTGRN